MSNVNDIEKMISGEVSTINLPTRNPSNDASQIQALALDEIMRATRRQGDNNRLSPRRGARPPLSRTAFTQPINDDNTMVSYGRRENIPHRTTTEQLQTHADEVARDLDREIPEKEKQTMFKRPKGNKYRPLRSPKKESWADIDEKARRNDGYEPSSFPPIERFMVKKSSEFNSVSDMLYHFERKGERNIEIEASFGSFGEQNNFQPNFSELAFGHLMQNLEKKVGAGRKTTYRVEIDSTTRIRRKVMTQPDGREQYIYQQKTMAKGNDDSIIDIPEWGIRFKASREEELPIDSVASSFSPSIIRQITRTSFILGKFIIDLSRVIETNISHRTPKQRSKFEVEVEKSDTEVDANDFRQVIVTIMSYCYSSISTNYPILSFKERDAITKIHNSLFPKPVDNKRKTSNRNMISNYWNKPVNLSLRDIIDPRFRKDGFPAITVKYDGYRKLLLLCEHGAYLVYPRDDIMKVSDKPFRTTLLDVEFMEQGFGDEKEPCIFAFDILFHNGVDLRNMEFINRLASLKGVVQQISSQIIGMKLSVKRYFMLSDFFTNVADAFKHHDEHLDAVDGLIFQPKTYYKNNYTYKWKPAEKLTIDFFVNANEAPYFFVSAKGNTLVPFSGSDEREWSGDTSNIPLEKLQEMNGQVVEFQFVDDRFEVVKVREDRPSPNFLDVAKKIWNDIQSPISRETLEGKDMVLLRKFHNLVKEDILAKNFSKDSVIVDFGSGRGGDLRKWMKLGFKSVYCIEPNEENADELVRRYKEMNLNTRPNVHLIRSGGQSPNIVSEIKDELEDQKISGCVSFFSLTFFTEKPEEFNALIKNIADLVPVGGKFVGIVMDGDKVEAALQEQRIKKKIAPGDGSVLDTGVFKIEQQSTFSSLGFGNEISINMAETTGMVHDQTEWLVYFKILTTALRRYGFQLVTTQVLDQNSGSRSLSETYELLPLSSQVFSSLNRAFCFQRTETKEPLASTIEKGMERMRKRAVKKSVVPKLSPVNEESSSDSDSDSNSSSDRDSSSDSDTDTEKDDTDSNDTDTENDESKYLPALEMNQIEPFYLLGDSETELVRIGVPEHSHNLFFAIMRAVKPELGMMDEDDYETYVDRVWRNVKNKLDPVVWKAVKLPRRLEYEVKSVLEEHDMAPEQICVIRALGALLRINILLLDEKGTFARHAKDVCGDECNEAKTIILCLSLNPARNFHIDVIGRQTSDPKKPLTLFKSSDDFIKSSIDYLLSDET